MSFPKRKDTDTAETFSATMRTTSSSVDAVLGKGTKVVGSLLFSGAVEIDGEVEGEINAKEKMTVGDSAVIKAKISAADLIIKGTVHGDVLASRSLVLKKPAKVYGNISSPTLSIEEGVLFEGKCAMQVKAADASASAIGAASTIGKHGEIKVSEVKSNETVRPAIGK
jgi:cytoskeletal protein CcmA (bactofilin family)